MPARVYPRAGGGTNFTEFARGLGQGSIPAQAGEPRPEGLRPVYPRAGGGTLAAGSPTGPSRVYPRAGGGTNDWSRTGVGHGVYPRAGGGTSADGARESGLSPRRRGNPTYPETEIASPIGSIPAQAGEPNAWHLGSIPAQPRTRVYPRAGGGTVRRDERATARWVYPRAGGGTACAIGHRGSIPAQAGEPLVQGRDLILTEVYPRAGGGTRHVSD